MSKTARCRPGGLGRASTIALVTIIGCLALVGCSGDDGPETLTVTIDGPADVEIPAGSQLHVELVDISLADAPAAVLSEADRDVSTVPVDVALGYDPTEIDDRHMYAIQARVEDADGNLVLITDTAELVLTNNAPTDRTTVTLVGLT